MWIHVAAVVRIDSFGAVSDGQIEDIFGKQCLWADDKEVWEHMTDFPEQYLLMGSEGSLQLSVWHNPVETDMPSTVVTIFGDLRDVYDPNEAVNWFKQKCELCDTQLIIRQAIISVTNGFEPAVTYVYENQNEDEKDER